MPWAGFGKKTPPAIQRADLGLYLGSVVAVNEDHGFVIVDASNAYAIPAGRKATLRREGGEVGEVEFAKERTGQFAAANITKGDARQGDEVYLPRE